MSATIEQLNLKRKLHHADCFLCGKDGLGLDFSVNKDGGFIAEVSSLHRLQGYDDVLHGGIVTSLLDAAMVNCLFAHGIVAFTAEIKVRFRLPVAVNCPVTVKAGISSRSRSIYKMEAVLLQDKRIMARAEAKFLKKSK